MRRIWLGVGVLLGLLVLGLLVMQITARQLGEISEMLEQASETEDWDRAVSLAEKARAEWEQKWHLMATLADHTDMDSIDGLFAQLNAYQRCRAGTDHAAACARLAEAVRDLEENHRFSWWNLL
jgi:hypothetical protein